MHDSCYIKLSSSRKLAQMKKRKEKQSQNIVSQDESSFSSGLTVTDESFSFQPAKYTCSVVLFMIRQNVFGVSRDQTPKP